jgi:hypothetical protein
LYRRLPILDTREGQQKITGTSESKLSITYPNETDCHQSKEREIVLTPHTII